MDAFTQQMLMMQLNSQPNQAMGQPYSYYQYPTMQVQPFTYFSHHDGRMYSQDGQAVHPASQQYQHSPHDPTVNPAYQHYQHYAPYSPPHIPAHDQGAHVSYQYYPHPPQQCQLRNHHPAAQTWMRAVRVAVPNAAHRSHGNNGGHGKPRNSHAHPPPGRDSRHRSSGKPSAAKAHGGTKHGSHWKSRREVDDGWSTAATRG